jgi:neutral ceramidase
MPSKTISILKDSTMTRRVRLIALLFLFSVAAFSTSFAADTKFRAGAARIDVTPSQEELPKPYTSVFDHIYARVIVVDNGPSRVVLASVDSATISNNYPADLAARIAKEANVPVENVMLATTHAHDSIRISNMPGTTAVPFSMPFNAKVEAALVDATRESIAKLQPARIGFGRGKAYINGNRMYWDPEQGRYMLGYDRSGKLPSDKTVYVVKFENVSGEPIAFFVNYALMPIVHTTGSYNGGDSRLGGDVPGATSQYAEKALGEKAVVIMTMGGGDQHPIYRVNRRGPEAQQYSESLIRTYSQILGEEILATSKDIRDTIDQGPLYASGKALTCPGKLTIPINDPSRCSTAPDSKLPLCGVYKEEDAPPVPFGINLLVIGDIALGAVSEDVGTTMVQRVQASSPYTNTIVISRLFGPARYLVTDDMYGLYTFDSTDSHVKKGCAEKSIVNGFQTLMPK